MPSNHVAKLFGFKFNEYDSLLEGAKELAAENDQDAALILLDELIINERYAFIPETYLARATIYFEQKKLEAARADCLKVINTLSKRVLGAHILLAKIYAAEKENTKFLKEMKRINELRGSIAVTRVWFNRTIVFNLTTHPKPTEEMELLITSLKEPLPNSSNVENLHYAIAGFADQKYDLASYYFEKSIKAAPYDFIAMFHLTNMTFRQVMDIEDLEKRQKKMELCLQQLDFVIAESGYARAHALRASINYSQQNYAQAMLDFAVSIKRYEPEDFPVFTEKYLQILSTLSKHGRKVYQSEDALKLIMKSGIAPAHDLKTAMGYEASAVENLANNNYQDALLYFSLAIWTNDKGKPGFNLRSSHYYNMRAQIHLILNNLPEANHNLSLSQRYAESSEQFISGCAGDELQRFALHILKGRGKTPHPKDPYLVYLLQITAADLYLKTEFPTIGMEIFKNTINEFPHLPDAYQRRMNFYLKTGKNAEALADIESGLKISPKNIALLNHLKTLSTDIPNSVAINKQIIEAVRKLETFKSWYEMALKNITAMPEECYQTNLAFLGEEALHNNNPRLAAYFYTLVTNANKHNFIARASRGIALIKLGDLRGASLDLKHNVYSRALLGMGLIEYEKGYKQGAGRYFRRGLSNCFETDFPLIFANEAFILETVTPVQESVLQAELYYMHGKLHFDNNDFEKAKPYFSMAIYLNDRFVHKYYFYRSLTQLLLYKHKAAHTDVTHAIDSAKRNNVPNEELLILKSLFSTYCLNPIAMAKQNLSKALTYIDLGLSVHPTRALHYERAKNRYQANSLDEVKESLTAMNAIAPPEGEDPLNLSATYLAEEVAKKLGVEVADAFPAQRPDETPTPVASSAIAIPETSAITPDAEPQVVKERKKKKKKTAQAPKIKSTTKKSKPRPLVTAEPAVPAEPETIIDTATPTPDEASKSAVVLTASVTITAEIKPEIATQFPSSRNTKTQRNKQRRRAGRRRAEEPASPLETSTTDSFEMTGDVITLELAATVSTPLLAVSPPLPETPDIQPAIELILPKGKTLKELLTWANKKPSTPSLPVASPVIAPAAMPEPVASIVNDVTEELIASVMKADSARADVKQVLNDLITHVEDVQTADFVHGIVNKIISSVITAMSVRVDVVNVINDLITHAEAAQTADIVHDILDKIITCIDLTQSIIQPASINLSPFVEAESVSATTRDLKISVSSLSLNDGLNSNQSSPIYASHRDSISQPRLSRLTTEANESEVELEWTLSPQSRSSLAKGFDNVDDKNLVRERETPNGLFSPRSNTSTPGIMPGFPASTRQLSANAATFFTARTPSHKEFSRFLFSNLPQQVELYELEQNFIQEVEAIEKTLTRFAPPDSEPMYFCTYILGGSLTDRVLKGLQKNLLAYHTPSIQIFNYLNKPMFQREIIVDDIDILTQLPIAMMSQVAVKLGWEPLTVIREPAPEQLGFAPDIQYRTYIKNGIKIDIVHKPIIDFAREAEERDSGLFMDRNGVLIDISGMGLKDLINGEVRVTLRPTDEYVIEPLKLLHAIHTSTKRKFAIHQREILKQQPVLAYPIQPSYINSALRKLFFPGRIVENYYQMHDFNFFQHIYWPHFSNMMLRDDEWIRFQLMNSDKQPRPSLKHIHAIFITNFVMHTVIDVLMSRRENFSIAFSPADLALQNGSLLNECNNVINMSTIFQDVYSKTSAEERNFIFETYINNWKDLRHQYIMMLLHPLDAPPAYVRTQQIEPEQQLDSYQNDNGVPEPATRHRATR